MPGALTATPSGGSCSGSPARTGPSTAWVAVRRDDMLIVGARDIGGLTFHIERTEKEDAGEPDGK